MLVGPATDLQADDVVFDEVDESEAIVVREVEDDQLHVVMLELDDAESLPVQDRLELLQRTEGLLAASLEALDGL